MYGTLSHNLKRRFRCKHVYLITWKYSILVKQEQLCPRVLVLMREDFPLILGEWRIIFGRLCSEIPVVFDVLYMQKFSPGENFRQFLHLLSLVKFYHANFCPVLMMKNLPLPSSPSLLAYIRTNMDCTTHTCSHSKDPLTGLNGACASLHVLAVWESPYSHLVVAVTQQRTWGRRCHGLQSIHHFLTPGLIFYALTMLLERCEFLK